MKYTDYFAESDATSDDILSDWSWLVPPELELWSVTKAGDALLRHTTEGTIHFLDLISGKVKQIAKSENEFEKLVATQERADEWLMPEIVDGQKLLGMIPARNQCLSYKIPPFLGGQIDPDNIETRDIKVHFSIAGQLHRQTKDLPPGTKISKILVDGKDPDAAVKRPWWRFW